MAKNYINNKEFTQCLADWKERGAPKPVPDYAAESFLKIVKGIASKRNFSGYTYIEDMKSEALEHCIKYADRFKIEKSTNAFAYFSQITYNAFIQYINKEKKYANFKFELNREGIENSHKFDRNLISSSEER